MEVTLVMAKDTKNTVRFEEQSVAQGQPPILGNLYLQKWAWTQLGQPQTITVTVAAAS